MKIKPREKTAILNSLGAGVVPGVGLHLLQVGRKRELESLISDLTHIEEGGATIRYVIGRFGSGKTFFLNLVRTVALEKRFVVLQGDISLERRFHSSDGAARALYTEFMNNMSTRAKPEGGAMPAVVEKFVADIAREAGTKAEPSKLERLVDEKLASLRDMTNGSAFVRVLARYVEGFSAHNDVLIKAAVRWLRGEYTTRTEAREDLDVRDIIEDGHLYDMMKVWSRFVQAAGYKGLFINCDEMVVLSERLNNAPARSKNYEVLLQILNDCLQGRASGIGFCFAGTEEFLVDRRRGLQSYEALATRLADNPYTAKGAVDMRSPVIRLQSLTREELFVLLEHILSIHSSGTDSKRHLDHAGIERFMAQCDKRLGAQHYLSPRDTVKNFVGLLNVLDQNPGIDLDSLLGQITPSVDAAKSTDKPAEEDQLARFKL